MPSPLKIPFRSLAAVIMAGLVLGILPPVVAAAAPETVVRTEALDLRPLAPGAAVTEAGAVRAPRASWSEPAVRCAPIRFTMVGVAWRQSGEAPVPVRLSWGSAGALDRSARVVADPDEGPDPGSPDDHGLQGTPPLWTGEAECLRVRLRLPAGEALRDVRLVYINSSGTAWERSALASLGDALARGWRALWGMAAPAPASALAKKPAIITRSEWGADESLRNEWGGCDAPDYAAKLKMAYVHHTAGSNSYTKAEADDVVRGVYAYHTGSSRKYCDIAYNFLIDRFGRIYEGRFGGMARPVIGAHAMGFNTGSTGVAAMGNFTTAKVPWKVTKAYKQLLAWRLDVAHRKPNGSSKMTSAGGSNTFYDAGEVVTLRTISGHRDTGYTTCPGQKLYDKLPAIRKGATKIGLPKIYNPRRNPKTLAPGEGDIRFRAKLSGKLDWWIEISNEAGNVVRRLTGTGKKIDRRWQGKSGGIPVPPGDYTVVIGAENAGGAAARTAKLSLTVELALP
ncbi:MAG TPA: N-acetylmuramoyl-L-alanine amidase [Actinomycetota bacterium]|nr:N-acetylmuramoyl-L-alanine amidase [Actinomycetota bacterium]